MEQTRFAPSVGYFKPLRIRAKIICVIYGGWFGTRDERIGQTFVEHLWALLAAGEADAVVFDRLVEDSLLFQTLLTNGPEWFCEKEPVWTAHWEMVLPQSGGFLQHKTRSKHRAWIRRKHRELEEAFPCRISWEWLRHFNDVPGLCGELEEAAAHTYHRALGVGFVNNEEHRQRLKLFAERGQLRVQLLKIDGRVHAFWIGMVVEGIFYSGWTAYAPSLGTYEVGTQVFSRMVDELIKEGVQKLDFGFGDAGYKQRFGDNCWREGVLRLFAPTPKGITLRCTLGFFAALDIVARRVLQKAGVLDRIKTRWRRHLAQTSRRSSNESSPASVADG
jgi:hypothetical protein